MTLPKMQVWALLQGGPEVQTEVSTDPTAFT